MTKDELHGTSNQNNQGQQKPGAKPPVFNPPGPKPPAPKGMYMPTMPQIPPMAINLQILPPAEKDTKDKV